ncbi:hypothetical protein JTB14_012413 [Gonioctena quinquepunctata]|nr:hypothetical protein JTB14_012413 [Gonioctena quinquepunctata]
MDENSDRFPLPKGPWTRNLDRFPKNFKEESILQYKDTSKHHLLVTGCSRQIKLAICLFIIAKMLLDYIRDERSYIPEDISCTSKQREWGTGSASLDNINIPLSVKWEHEFHQIVEERMLLKHCQISEKDAVELEKQTRGQNQCKLWFEERKKRLTSSKFGDVIKRKGPVNQKMINNIC